MKWDQWMNRRPIIPLGKEHIQLTNERTARIIEHCLSCSHAELKRLARPGAEPTMVWIIASSLLREGEFGQFRDTNRLLDRVIGKAKQQIELTQAAEVLPGLVDFHAFVARAGYPEPFALQEAMRAFAFENEQARLLLGARNYGKTDYVTILGTAYAMYVDYMASLAHNVRPSDTTLLVTKSEDRNAAIASEIVKACAANGVPFEKESAKALRVKGLKGKDHSLAAITVGSSGVRGRHPKRIIMDDPVTEEDASEATRKRVYRLYNELSKLTPNVLIIGQPVHKFDLYETLRPLLLKMEVKHGEIPELDHDLNAQRLAGVSEESIQASYFLKVVSETGNPLEDVQFIDSFPPGSSVAFIDPSFEGGDYTAMTVIKAHFEGVAVFGKCWKRAWYNCVDDINEVVKTKGVQRLCFETNSLGEQPVVLLRDVIEGCGVVGKKSLGNKHARISAAGPFAKSIFLAKDSDRAYIDQIVKYEYGIKNDDAPDSLASAMEWIGLIKGRQ